MPAIGTLKRITEKIAGWARPAPDDLGDLVRQRKPQTYRFKDDGVVMHFGVGRARQAGDLQLPETDGRIGGDWDTVKALRLMIPQAFLLRACEVIE